MLCGILMMKVMKGDLNHTAQNITHWQEAMEYIIYPIQRDLDAAQSRGLSNDLQDRQVADQILPTIGSDVSQTAPMFFCSLFRNRENAQTPPVTLSEPEFPRLVSVSYYHSALQSTAYISNPNINSHKVVELVRFKRTTRSGFRYKKQVHQQVVVKVEAGEPGVYGYLCIERAQTRLCYNTLENLVLNSSPSIHFEKFLDSLIEDGMPIGEAGSILHMKRNRERSIHAEDTHSGDSSTNASTRNAYSEGSSESSASVATRWSALDSNPDDTVSRVSDYPRGIGVKRLETLKPTNLRLCDFAILVGAVHDLNALYSVFHAQRWWFANLIMRIVEKDHETIEVPVRRYGLRRNSKDEVCSEAGRWYKLRVNRTLKVVVGMIRLQYYEGRRKFDKRVEWAVRHGRVTVTE